MVALRRFEEFLRLEEHNAEQRGSFGNGQLRTFGTSTKSTFPERPFISFNNFNASWTDTTPTLNGIDFCAHGNELICVVGAVGSGKSSLLMSILGELYPSTGSATISGTIGYASQEAWILSDTIKDNITFGRQFDTEWYEKTIDACALRADLALFEHGDKTEVGERGVTLSGGQKARLSLCRAVYSNSDIYLLDDPLSAVDAKVGRKLFADCINGILKDKLRILVTHQLQFLREADRIIVLDSNGQIDSLGTYDELMQSSSSLTEILAQHEEKEQTDDHITTEAVPIQVKPEPDATIQAEGRVQGKVGGKTYWAWSKAAAGTRGVVLFLTISVVAQVSMHPYTFMFIVI